jgi:type III secretory pathway component EscU
LPCCSISSRAQDVFTQLSDVANLSFSLINQLWETGLAILVPAAINAALDSWAGTAWDLTVSAVVTFALLALFDFFWERYQFTKQNMMEPPRGRGLVEKMGEMEAKLRKSRS